MLSTAAYSAVLNGVLHFLLRALYGRVRRSTAHTSGCAGHTTEYGALWYSKGALGWLVLLQTLVEGGALVRALRALRLLSDRHSALAPDVVQRRRAFRLPTSATPTRPLVCRGRWRRMPPTRRVRAICVRFTHFPCSDRRMFRMLSVRVELGGVWLCSVRQPPSSCSGTLARHRVGTVRCHGVLRRARQLRRAEWQ